MCEGAALEPAGGILHNQAMPPRIFPAALPERIASNPLREGEARVYRSLAGRLGPDHAVFHALRWRDGVPGGGEREAGFVVAHPRQGVLVLEVRAGEAGRDGLSGAWHSVDGHGGMHPMDDPFARARDNRRSLLARLSADPRWKGSGAASGYGVAFPDCARGRQDLGLEAAREMVAFEEDLPLIDRWVERAFAFWRLGIDAPDEIGEDGVAVIAELAGG
jgi:hypothetical protein